MKSLKNLSLALLIAISFASCNQEPPTYVYRSRDITPEELNYFPYQVNDQILFKNKNGNIIEYVCESRNHYTDPYDPKQHCPGNKEWCDVVIKDHLNIELKCITDSKYNIKLGYTADENLGFVFPNYSFYDFLSAPELNMNSPCGINTYENNSCVDSVIFNNKKYYNAAKLIRINSPTELDTLYYNKQFGILKFSINREQWSLQ